MSPLSFLRFVLALLFCAGVIQAQTTATNSDKVLLTVTNKSDLELSVGLHLLPNVAEPSAPPPSLPGSTNAPTALTPRNKVTQFRIEQTVQPQQQVVLQIPKGKYMVEAITPFSLSSTPLNARRNLRVSRSHEFNDTVERNEVWTFELENGPGGSLDPNDRVAQWKRTVQPARPAKASDAIGLRSIPERTHRLTPGDLKTPQGLRQIPERTLKLPPSAPTP